MIFLVNLLQVRIRILTIQRFPRRRAERRRILAFLKGFQVAIPFNKEKP